jgi:alpha-D-ribose 1-methylphosphonate 5-triphosphate synthase subunit PhnG
MLKKFSVLLTTLQKQYVRLSKDVGHQEIIKKNKMLSSLCNVWDALYALKTYVEDKCAIFDEVH